MQCAASMRSAHLAFFLLAYLSQYNSSRTDPWTCTCEHDEAPLMHAEAWRRHCTTQARLPLTAGPKCSSPGTVGSGGFGVDPRGALERAPSAIGAPPTRLCWSLTMSLTLFLLRLPTQTSERTRVTLGRACACAPVWA